MAERLDNGAQAKIGGPEVVPPFADTVRFVNHKECRPDLLETFE